jgi:hypothetical protein
LQEANLGLHRQLETLDLAHRESTARKENIEFTKKNSISRVSKLG